VLTKSEPVIFTVQSQSTSTAAAAATEATAAPTLTASSGAAGAPAAVTNTNAVSGVNAVAVAPQSLTLTATAAVPMSEQAVATAKSGDEPQLTITSSGANVRAGPGTEYEVVGTLQNGAAAQIRGKNADSSWWQIVFATAPAGVGWVRADLAQANGSAASVPVINPVAQGTPTAPATAPATVPATALATRAAATTPQATAVAQTTVWPTWTPAPAATATPAERPCDANTPGWAGADPKYPFCVAKTLTWYDNQDGAHRYENGHDVPVSLSWDIWGVDAIWMIFDQDNSGYCDFTKQAARTINQPVQNAGTYAFNVKDFSGGATMRIYLRIKRKDGQVVEYGDKRLCIF
jgi:hypothetical protein